MSVVIETSSTDPVSDEALACETAARLAKHEIKDAAAAFFAIYERHSRGVLAFVAARTGRNDAEDVSQEVWQRVWRNIADRFDGRHFRGWLYEIARNCVADVHRRRQHEELPPQVAAPVVERVDSIRVDALRLCFERLASFDAPAAAVVRGIWQGDDYASISIRLGLTRQRAYELFYKAKPRLKKCIEERLA